MRDAAALFIISTELHSETGALRTAFCVQAASLSAVMADALIRLALRVNFAPHSTSCSVSAKEAIFGSLESIDQAVRQISAVNKKRVMEFVASEAVCRRKGDEAGAWAVREQVMALVRSSSAGDIEDVSKPELPDLTGSEYTKNQVMGFLVKYAMYLLPSLSPENSVLSIGSLLTSFTPQPLSNINEGS